MKLVIQQDQLLIIFGFLAILLVLMIWRVFRKWSKDESNNFSMIDLFMENGRASKSSVVLLGAFAATTWFFVYYAVTGRMTEGYFGLYAGAWIAPIVARVLTGADSRASDPGSTVTTTTETTVKP